MAGANGSTNNDRVYPVRALREFARAKPWQGTVEERIEKYRTLHQGFAEAYQRPVGLRFVDTSTEGTSERSGVMFHGDKPIIVLKGKLSVITFLFLWSAVLRPRNRPAAMDWAHRAFTRFFPRSAARLVHRDGLFHSE